MGNARSHAPSVNSPSSLIAVAPVTSAASTRGAPPDPAFAPGAGAGLAPVPATAGAALSIKAHIITLAPAR